MHPTTAQEVLSRLDKELAEMGNRLDIAAEKV
jgi:hypothetical protein